MSNSVYLRLGDSPVDFNGCSKVFSKTYGQILKNDITRVV